MEKCEECGYVGSDLEFVLMEKGDKGYREELDDNGDGYFICGECHSEEISTECSECNNSNPHCHIPKKV